MLASLDAKDVIPIGIWASVASLDSSGAGRHDRALNLWGSAEIRYRHQ